MYKPKKAEVDKAVSKARAMHHQYESPFFTTEEGIRKRHSYLLLHTSTGVYYVDCASCGRRIIFSKDGAVGTALSVKCA